MARIVILGGGLAGISAAYHLEQKGFFDYQLFEKENSIGGLCGSIQQDGFTFDYTGHLLHINDPYFHDLIARVVGFDQFNVIHRRSYIYSHQQYTPYPFQMHLHGLPTEVIADCIAGYIKRATHIRSPKTFVDWVHKQFGAGFARHFFLPYQRKIFAHDLNKITASWTGRFVPQTSLEAIIEGTMYPAPAPSVGYNAQFFYPKQGGIVSWVAALARKLHQPINYQHEVVAIDSKARIVTFANGHRQPYDKLVTTLPLDRMLAMLETPSNRSFSAAQNNLMCNSVLNFNLGINRPNVSDKHWIYFAEKEFPFYRIGFTSNFATSMTPPGCSSLYGEIAYMNMSAARKDAIVARSIKQVQQLCAIDDHEIATQKVLDISHAYVIYNFWREKHLTRLLQTLAQDNIHSIGRYGAWKYCSMQETLLDGKQIADILCIQPARRYYETVTINPLSYQERIHEQQT
jgi:protoporphyrinogen oxidase